MMWLKLYQSAICWLFPAELTAPSHSLTVPHVHMGGRPIIRRMTAVMAMIRAEMSQICCLIFRIACTFPPLTFSSYRVTSRHG